MLDGAAEADGAFTDAADLVNRLASSTVVSQCFVRHTFTYWLGRTDAPADSCTLVAVHKAFQKNGGDYIEMLAALFTSRSFLYRKGDSL